MKILINGKDDVLDVTPDTSLGELLSQLRAFLVKHDQLASHITLDNELLSEENEIQFSETPVTEFTKLEITTSSLNKQVIKIFAGFLTLIDKLKKKSSSTGALLQQGKRTEALEQLQGLIENLTVFADGLTYSTKALENLNADSCPPGENDLEEFKEILSRLYDCLTAEEEVEFADLLNFELPDNLEGWRGIIEKTITSLVSQTNEEKNSKKSNSGNSSSNN